MDTNKQDIQLNDDGTFANMASLWRHLLAGGVAECNKVRIKLDANGNVNPRECPTRPDLWRPYARQTVSFQEAMEIVTHPDPDKRRRVRAVNSDWLKGCDGRVEWSDGTEFMINRHRVRARYEVEGME